MRKTKTFYREIGSKGGRAKVRKGYSFLTPKEAKENARRASLARWGEAHQPVADTPLGKLQAALRRTERRRAELKRLIAAAKEAR